MTAANPTPSPRRVPFYMRPHMRLLAPFITSAAFHVAVIGTAVVLFRAAQKVFEPPTREQVIIPDTNLVENADNGGVPNPGLNGDPTRAGSQSVDDTVHSSDDWATRKTDTLAQNLLRGSADVSQNTTPIGAGAAVGGGQVSGLNTAGLGDAASGNLAPFGPVDGGGAGQGKGLFGIRGGNVHRVIYVCDASGSLFGSATFDLIKRELATAIGNLKRSQTFTVYFFRDLDRPPEMLNNRADAVVANEQNKAAAYRMIEQLEPKGQTNPTHALETAFKQQPEMVFLLLDNIALDDSHDFGAAALANTLDALDHDAHVRFALIICGDATEQQLAPWREVVRKYGGDLRRVTRQTR